MFRDDFQAFLITFDHYRTPNKVGLHPVLFNFITYSLDQTFLENLEILQLKKHAYNYEDGDLRVGVRGGTTTLKWSRFLESARIAIKFGTNKVEV